MPPFQGDELYQNRDQILASFIAAFQASIPDIWIAEDGNLYLLLNVEAGVIEGLYLANQILLENMFIQSAGLAALQRHGEQFGVLRKTGTQSSGNLLFTGEGGVYIPIGSEVSYDPGGDSDPIYFTVTQDGTIPNPGVPGPPVATDAGAGAIAAGTYEYVVTFLTTAGEGLPSDPSNALVIAANHQIGVTIPVGGPGTISRKLYRSLNGDVFHLVNTINDNITTAITDNLAAAGTQQPPTNDTSLSILLAAEAEDPGADGNVVAGAITTLANVPDGLTDVTNPVPFLNGSDEEDTDAYRTRLLQVLRSPQSGSSSDLESWATAVEGVDTATAFPNDNLGTPTPGHVTVRIAGPNATIPSSDIVAAVLAALQAQDLANITIHVTTFDPLTVISVIGGNIVVTMTPETGFVHADLVPSVQQAIVDYVNSVPVGGTLYVSGLIAAIMVINGVQDITVQNPTANHTAGATQKFTITTTNITVN